MKTYKAQSAQRTLQWNMLVAVVHIKHLDAKTHFWGALNSDLTQFFFFRVFWWPPSSASLMER